MIGAGLFPLLDCHVTAFFVPPARRISSLFGCLELECGGDAACTEGGEVGRPDVAASSATIALLRVEVSFSLSATLVSFDCNRLISISF